MGWSSDDKRRFRQRKVWQDFTDKLWTRSKGRCELLGTKITAKTANYHHVFPSEYDNLNEYTEDGKHRFWVLSSVAHDLVEHVAKVYHGQKSNIPNVQAMLDWLGPYLPEPEGGVQKYYDELDKLKLHKKMEKVLKGD